MIDKAASNGAIHKNTAARKKSQAARARRRPARSLGVARPAQPASGSALRSSSARCSSRSAESLEPPFSARSSSASLTSRRQARRPRTPRTGGRASRRRTDASSAPLRPRAEERPVREALQLAQPREVAVRDADSRGALSRRGRSERSRSSRRLEGAAGLTRRPGIRDRERAASRRRVRRAARPRRSDWLALAAQVASLSISMARRADPSPTCDQSAHASASALTPGCRNRSATHAHVLRLVTAYSSTSPAFAHAFASVASFFISSATSASDRRPAPAPRGTTPPPRRPSAFQPPVGGRPSSFGGRRRSRRGRAGRHRTGCPRCRERSRPRPDVSSAETTLDRLGDESRPERWTAISTFGSSLPVIR